MGSVVAMIVIDVILESAVGLTGRHHRGGDCPVAIEIGHRFCGDAVVAKTLVWCFHGTRCSGE